MTWDYIILCSSLSILSYPLLFCSAVLSANLPLPLPRHAVFNPLPILSLTLSCIVLFCLTLYCLSLPPPNLLFCCTVPSSCPVLSYLLFSSPSPAATKITGGKVALHHRGDINILLCGDPGTVISHSYHSLSSFFPFLSTYFFPPLPFPFPTFHFPLSFPLSSSLIHFSLFLSTPFLQSLLSIYSSHTWHLL